MALAFGWSIVAARRQAGAARLVRFFRLAARRAGERRALLDLDDNQLRDIGLTPMDVRREACRWPWDGCDNRV